MPTDAAAWVHETDGPMRADLEDRGYTLAETTRAMALDLADLRVPRPQLELGPPEWSAHVAMMGQPGGFLAGLDEAAFHVVMVHLDGRPVATGMAFDAAGDCGVFNVGTEAPARRRGLGTAVTPMAEGVYRSVGFRDLGRILEYAPKSGAGLAG